MMGAMMGNSKKPKDGLDQLIEFVRKFRTLLIGLGSIVGLGFGWGYAQGYFTDKEVQRLRDENTRLLVRNAELRTYQSRLDSVRALRPDSTRRALGGVICPDRPNTNARQVCDAIRRGADSVWTDRPPEARTRYVRANEEWSAAVGHVLAAIRASDPTRQNTRLQLIATHLVALADELRTSDARDYPNDPRHPEWRSAAEEIEADIATLKGLACRR